MKCHRIWFLFNYLWRKNNELGTNAQNQRMKEKWLFKVWHGSKEKCCMKDPHRKTWRTLRPRAGKTALGTSHTSLTFEGSPTSMRPMCVPPLSVSPWIGCLAPLHILGLLDEIQNCTQQLISTKTSPGHQLYPLQSLQQRRDVVGLSTTHRIHRVGAPNLASLQQP